MKNEQTTESLMPSEIRKWTVAIIIALIMGSSAFPYVFISVPNIGLLQATSFVLAAVSSFLFACSLSLGSFSYYLGWPNVKYGYQKQIGILAYYLALLYSLTLVILYPELYWFGLPNHWLTVDVLFGLGAMAIFTAMTFINSAWVAPHFKWDTIKFVLGLGYVGYALLAIRAILIEWELWETWFLTLEGFPPGRLILALVALLVLLLRISIPIHKNLFTKLTPNQ